MWQLNRRDEGEQSNGSALPTCKLRGGGRGAARCWIFQGTLRRGTASSTALYIVCGAQARQLADAALEQCAGTCFVVPLLCCPVCGACESSGIECFLGCPKSI